MRHLICFGNELHSDDGFGMAVFRRLEGVPLAPQTRLFAAATRGLDALALFDGCREAVVIDALAPGISPGTLRWLDPEQVNPEDIVGLPGHGAGVGYLLQCLQLLGGPVPRVRILGVEAQTVAAFQPGLSAPVASAVELAVAELMRG